MSRLSRSIAVDRHRLAGLPGQPPPDVPLVCLDTETTGLATAAGTVAFLIGLGWWEGERFRQVQLLLPDHAEERALLTALAATIPANAWLVTYNGRGFDWPLLVARYRLARRAAPVHAGHLDLLPIVRRLFRHRMGDARLRTAEAQLLGLHRIGDVEGWEIPGRYLHFLRSGSAAELVDVVRHNDQDVRSLARLLVHLEVELGDPQRRVQAVPGDLAGLARSFAREHRLAEALHCLEIAVAAPIRLSATPAPDAFVAAPNQEDRWWAVRRRPDYGGRPVPPPPVAAGLASPWTDDRIRVERARILRRLGRYLDAADAWEGLAAGPGLLPIHAWIEVAKLREHRLADPLGALDATRRAVMLAERRHRIGLADRAVEHALAKRLRRLEHRTAMLAVSAPSSLAPAGPPRSGP